MGYLGMGERCVEIEAMSGLHRKERREFRIRNE